MVTSSYSVTGMTCSHCVAAVSAEVGRIEGVASVHVELASGTLEIVSGQPVEPTAVAAAVQEAGYELAR